MSHSSCLAPWVSKGYGKYVNSLLIPLWGLITFDQILEPAEKHQFLSDFLTKESFQPEYGRSTLKVGIDVGWVRLMAYGGKTHDQGAEFGSTTALLLFKSRASTCKREKILSFRHFSSSSASFSRSHLPQSSCLMALSILM